MLSSHVRTEGVTPTDVRSRKIVLKTLNTKTRNAPALASPDAAESVRNEASTAAS